MPITKLMAVAGMLLLVAAAQSLIILQLAPLASSAGVIRRPPKIGSYQSTTSPARTQPLKDFFRKHGSDIAQSLIPPPAAAGSASGGQKDNAPATTMGLYFADLIVGTTPVSGILDICTQFVWMQCDCSGGTAAVCPRVVFNPLVDTTNFQRVLCEDRTCQGSLSQRCAGDDSDCGYYVQVGDATLSIGYLANDTFTFGTTPVQGMIFGCSTWSDGRYYGPVSSVIGMGRGNLSLVTQLELYNFSYFLAPVGSSNSVNELQLGGVTVPPTGRSTPLLPSPYLYYVRLISIKVDDEELVGIPAGTFDLRADGSGGVFLSTTTPVTYLVEDAYCVLRQAFVNKIPSQPLESGGLDSLCYTAQSVNNVPSLTLVFDGEDAEMELRTPNYFYEFNDGERDLECLAILPSRDASLLGSLLQTGTTMIYDLVGEQLTFVTEEAQAAAAASLGMLNATVVWVLSCCMLHAALYLY